MLMSLFIPVVNVRLFTFYFLQKYELILNNVQELLKICKNLRFCMGVVLQGALRLKLKLLFGKLFLEN